MDNNKNVDIRTEVERAQDELISLLSSPKRAEACALYAGRVIASEVMDMAGLTALGDELRAISTERVWEAAIIVAGASLKALYDETSPHYFAHRSANCAARALEVTHDSLSMVGDIHAAMGYGAYTLTRGLDAEHAKRTEFRLRHYRALIDLALSVTP